MNLDRFTMKVLVTLALAVGAVTAPAADTRIAVAADGPLAQAPVSKVAARAPQILIFDAQGRLLAAYANPVAANPGGAGPAMARWLGDKQVTVLIAGDVGTNMAAELQRLQIRSVKASGPAEQAVKAVKP
ncbi:MAG: NifB/NifX family molybdenum-iron cluster-binding protein [Rubrivivax sp.]|nr:NifB/NifX family molybdenum-iron cluster-binding protein [Rubrivivax sp.]